MVHGQTFLKGGRGLALFLFSFSYLVILTCQKMNLKISHKLKSYLKYLKRMEQKSGEGKQRFEKRGLEPR